MIVNFRDAGTEDLFLGRNTRAAGKICPERIWKVARRKLDQIEFATRLDTLAIPGSNRLEALKGDRRGEYSIRINDQYRVCFRWTEQGAEDVEIVDYH